MATAGQDSKVAFKYYLWNCTLCESFHLSLHFAEVVSRNAFHNGLLNRLGDTWYNNNTFRNILDMRFLKELNEAMAQEAYQHGQFMTAHHIVSALNFGFWEHLATKRFERLLWAKGIWTMFPNAPAKKTYEDLHTLVESVRRWRNRIAHHRAIFDKKPMGKHDDALELIKWVCIETGQWAASVSTVPAAIALRPK